jgi:hypothetical protein
MNQEQENQWRRAKALEIAALILGKAEWPHEGSAMISGRQRVSARDPKPYDEIFTPYRSLADLIAKDIRAAGQPEK